MGLLSRRAAGPALALLVLMHLVGERAVPQVLNPSDCQRIRLPESEVFGWITSGGWWPDRDEIVLVDVLRERLLGVDSRSGGVSARSSDLSSTAGQEPRRLRAPSRIRRTATGYLVEDDFDDHIVILDGSFGWVDEIKVKGELEADAASPGAVPRVEAIHGWAPLNDGVVAYADILEPATDDKKAAWYSGIVYLDGSGNRQVLHQFATTDYRNHYIRNDSYIASLGATAYVLFYDKTPWIGEGRVDGGEMLPLSNFQTEFSSVPPLKRRRGWPGSRQATVQYREIEGSEMAVGIYAWEDLYLLAKGEISASGRTEWWLIRLDRDDGAELSRVRLPTEAAHLTVVPGDTWAFVEKSPVQAVGKFYAPFMNTTSIFLVSEDKLRSSSEALGSCSGFVAGNR